MVIEEISASLDGSRWPASSRHYQKRHYKHTMQKEVSFNNDGWLDLWKDLFYNPISPPPIAPTEDFFTIAMFQYMPTFDDRPWIFDDNLSISQKKCWTVLCKGMSKCVFMNKQEKRRLFSLTNNGIQSIRQSFEKR